MSWTVRVLIGVAVLIAVAFVAFNMFRVQLVERAYLAAVDRQTAIDPLSELEDGLHVYVCGSGSPMASPSRAGPCVGVLAGDQAFIFDAGAGGIRKLMAMQFPVAKLEGAYLTHLHSDHIDGLGELMLQAWIAGTRAEPLPISGPIGTEKVVTAFTSAYEIDKGYRIAHHGTVVANPDGFGGAPKEIFLPLGPSVAEVVYESADVKITAIRVEHAPVEPAFGYRIDYKDRSISLSGDTIYHPGFVAASQGVDVMLHEALDPEMVQQLGSGLKSAGRETVSKVMFDILDYHATPEDAARAAANAGAQELIYYHIVPPLPMRALNAIWLGDSADEFDGKMTVGEDGMMISLPAGERTIQHSRAF
ncbi:MAG: MBL fold metallo-hydrolase [Pseudomonadota bacterium]